MINLIPDIQFKYSNKVVFNIIEFVYTISKADIGIKQTIMAIIKILTKNLKRVDKRRIMV